MLRIWTILFVLLQHAFCSSANRTRIVANSSQLGRHVGIWMPLFQWAVKRRRWDASTGARSSFVGMYVWLIHRFGQSSLERGKWKDVMASEKLPMQLNKLMRAIHDRRCSRHILISRVLRIIIASLLIIDSILLDLSIKSEFTISSVCTYAKCQYVLTVENVMG